MDAYELEQKKGEIDFLFLEAALLIEEGYGKICDELWYIYVKDSVRRARLKQSRGYSDEKIVKVERILDRKIRIVNENTQTEKDWLFWIREAYKTTYGFEWQGDSLLIARENLLFTFIDYYHLKIYIIILKDI